MVDSRDSKKKDGLVTVEGIVTEILPDSRFSVKLKEYDAIIIAHVSGRMRKNRIRVLVGDEVTVEVSIHDLTRGRVVHRLSNRARYGQ